MSSLARHSLPYPSQSALAGQRIRFRPNGMAVRGSLVLGLTIMRLFVRVGVVERQWPSPNDSPQLQTPPDTAPPFRLAITPYRKRLPLPMTSHCRNRRTFAGQTESPSRLRAKRNLRLASVWGDGRARFSITRSLASLGFRLAYPPSRVTACLVRLSQHLRVIAFVFRPNGMAVRGSSVLGLTGMRLFVRVGGVERAETVTHRQPATANATCHRTSIPFGHHAISKMLAVADDITLSEPPDVCRPNGISVSQVYGDTGAYGSR